MTALVILAAAVLGVVLIVASIRNAADRVTAELRAIAEQEADERRQAGIAAGFAAGWHTTSRRAK